MQDLQSQVMHVPVGADPHVDEHLQLHAYSQLSLEIPFKGPMAYQTYERLDNYTENERKVSDRLRGHQESRVYLLHEQFPATDVYDPFLQTVSLLG